MSIIEIETPMFWHRNPKCRACKWYGNADDFYFYAECQCQDNNIRRRIRNHNDKACTSFGLADWLKRPVEVEK